MAVSSELRKLYEKDKRERTDSSINGDVLKQHSEQKIKRAKELIQEIDTNDIWNLHYLAYLLQHGTTIEDYKMAHEFAKKAVKLGSTVSKWLFAATLDRWLVSQGKKQKFGTQFKKNNKGVWEILPVDGTISNEQRKEYGVPPLNKALEVFKKKYPI